MTYRGDDRGRGPRNVAAALAILWLGGMGAACSSGRPGGSPDPAGTVEPAPFVAPLCTTRDPGPAPLRRLSRIEYARTMDDLVGVGMVDASRLPPDERALGFANNAEIVSTGNLLVQAYADLAEQAGDVVAAHPETFVPCATVAADAACAATFIAGFGRRAWRRALDPAEQAALAAVYGGGETDGGFSEGIARVTAVLLSSPQFLYRLEAGTNTAAPDVPNAVALAPGELATRLAYLVWGSMPDATLLDAVDADRLATAADLAREARRMLGDPRARDVVTTFHAEWLGFDQLAGVSKDQIIYPMFTPQLAELFTEETTRFVEEVVWNGAGTLSALLTTPSTFGDATLASFYGAPPPVAGGFGPITPAATQRAGLLTQGAFLSVYGKANQSDPIHRGRFVRERMLCTTPPPPPPDIVVRPPELDPRLTTRERFAAHTSEPRCAGCHTLLDPIGFGFEHYDGMGRWRDMEGGQPVDGTGTLSASDVDGNFDGAVALSSRLAVSHEVELCYATQWFRFGYGRGETEADACTLGALAKAFMDAKGDVRELVVALTQTDAFRYRRAGDEP